MTKILSNSNSCTGRTFSTPTSNPKPLTVLRSYALAVFLLLFLLPTGALAQYSLTLNNEQNYTSNITLPSSGTYTINVPNGTAFISGSFSYSTSTCTVEKYGSGKLVLVSNTNNVPGLFDIKDGTLQIGNGLTGKLTATQVKIGSGCTLRFEPGDNYTFAIPITGTGKMEYKGEVNSKCLYLTKNNTYSGTTTVEAGRMLLGFMTQEGNITGNIILTNGTVLQFYRTDDFTYSGVISGTGKVKQWGTQTTTLTGVNTFEGLVEISAGKLRVGNGTSGSINNCSNVIIDNGATLRFEPGANMIFDKVISGEGKVEYKGANSKKLFLTENNTYTGTTTIEDNSILTIGNNTLKGAIAGNIINNGNGLTFSRKNDYVYAGEISGTGKVSKENAGKVTLTGANTYTGKTSIDGGTLQIGNGTSGSIATTSDVVIAIFATLRFEPGSNMVFSKVISGNGNVEYKGSSSKVLIFSADNTYAGTTTIETGGVLQLGNDGTTGSVKGNIVNEGTLKFYHRGTITIDGQISGSGKLVKEAISPQGNNSITTLNGANTYLGETQIDNGILALGASGSIENSSGVNFTSTGFGAKFDISAGIKKIKALNGSNVNDNIVLGSQMLTIGTSGENDGGGTFAGKITGIGGIYKYGSGTLTLSSTTSDYSNGTLIYEGTIVFSHPNSLGTDVIGFIGSKSKTLRWASVNTADISGRISFNSTVTLDIGSNNVTFASNFKTIPTSSTLTKAGSGKLTITAANIYGGAIVVSEGTLQIGNGTSGSLSSVSGVSIASGATLRFEPGAALVFEKKITGAGKVQYLGSYSKSLTFTADNDYTGTTTVEGQSSFVIGNNTPTGSVAGDITISHAQGYVDFKRSNDYTHAGAISGAGNINKYNPNKVILKGNNSYLGKTQVSGGTLQIGDGTPGGDIICTSGVELSTTSCVLRFEPYDNMIFGKVISGSGKVEYKGKAYLKLHFTAENTYTGTTTIESGELSIGNNTPGAIAGDIVITSGSLIFDCSNEYTYSKVISGNGSVCQSGKKKLTLNGVNTYTGETKITSNTLALGANGKIENSSNVFCEGANSKFDISAGDKKIKALSGANASAEVILGNKTLTIGTAGVNEGERSYLGIFTGTGGSVTKLGTGTLTLNNTANTATGTFSHNEGLLKMTGKWAGNFTKTTGASLEVLGEVTIGGNFTIPGGNITMNLNTTPKAKITVNNTVFASGVNTLNITTAAITNYALMVALNGGITILTPYALNMPGMTGTLSVSAPNQLLLTATIQDNTPPKPGANGVINGTAAIVTADLNWTAAEDPGGTPTNELRYFVYRSTSNNITSVANCEVNGTLLNNGGTQNITTFNATGLEPNTPYYFNVVVTDMVGNKAAYVTKSLTTNKATLLGSVTIPANSVFGETITANVSGLKSSPVVPLGTLSYQWKRNNSNISGATDSTYIPVQDDILQVITVTVTAANCDGSSTSGMSFPQKATQTAPPAPTAANITSSTITLNTMDGCEYRMNGGDWQASPVFTGLQPTTTYTFEAYKPETNTHSASAPSPIAYISTIEVGVASTELSNQITVYPNPTTGELTIDNGQLTINNVELYDVMGKKQLSIINCQLSIEKIDLTVFPAGIYFLKITTENGVVTKKVIKH